MKQFNAIFGDEPTEPRREWKILPPSVHLKYPAYPPKTIPVVSAIMGRIHNIAIGNGDVEFYPSEYPFEYTSDSIPDPHTPPIE